MEISQLQEKVKMLAELRREKEARTKHLEEIQSAVTLAQREITEVLMEQNMSNFRVDGVGLVSIKKYESVKSPENSLAWKDLADYVRGKYGDEVFYSKFKMHSKTLDSFYKEERAELPEEEQEFFKLPGVGPTSMSFDLSFRKESE